MSSSSHPNGIVPDGNLLLSDSARKSFRLRFNGLGPLFYRLTDEQIVDLLTYMDAPTLLRLGITSRVFHVFSSLDYLWRDLVLQEMENTNIIFRTNWRTTYLSLKGRSSQDALLKVRVDGLCSGFLFKQWLCSSIRFERDVPNFFKFNDIPRIEASELSVEDFVVNYEIANKPLIVKNAVNDWPALKKWQNLEYLSKVCGAAQKCFRATSAAASRAASFTMEEYIQYASTVQEEAPLYLFERDFAAVPELPHDYTVPAYFRESLVLPLGEGNVDTVESGQGRVHVPDLFSLVGEQRRPDYKWLVVGPASSGSLFHIDPNMTNAWNVSLAGRKKWIFYPPTRVPPGVQRSDDGADVTVPISTSEWLLTFWAYHLEARHDPDVSQRPLEAIAEPGDLMFVPHGWWHMVVNLDFCVALTHNYVSTSNLADVLRFLREKRDQVSGVRDRSSVALQPEELYETFLAELTQYSAENHRNNSEDKTVRWTQQQLDAVVAESMLNRDINRDADQGQRGQQQQQQQQKQQQQHEVLMQNRKRRRRMPTRQHYATNTSDSVSGGLLSKDVTSTALRSGQNKKRKQGRHTFEEGGETTHSSESSSSGDEAEEGEGKRRKLVTKNTVASIFHAAANASEPSNATAASFGGFSFGFDIMESS